LFGAYTCAVWPKQRVASYDGRVAGILTFVAVVAVVVVVPGPDMALVLQNGLARGRRAAVESALGINAGLLVWAIAAALGVAGLLHASTPAFTALKLAGAAYLVWLGLHALAAAVRRTPPEPSERARRRGSAFRQGLLSNLLNPKIALVFTTLIPQFVDPARPAVPQTLLLAAIFLLMGLVWLTSYALLVAKVSEVLRRSAVRRALNALTGAVLTALGVRLAFERR
jgi:RhtB (resistance to homoserine/threonine) family protein